MDRYSVFEKQWTMVILPGVMPGVMSAITRYTRFDKLLKFVKPGSKEQGAKSKAKPNSNLLSSLVIN